MGAIVGAGLLSHAPVIMFPEEQRIAVNGGRDFSLATGLTRLRADVFEQAEYDTVLVLDSHWTTTTEFVVTSHAERAGIFTSSEMPTLLRQIAYDIPGDPALARAIVEAAAVEEAWAVAVDDLHLPIQYATLNLWSYLAKPGKAWVSISVCQTATVDDYIRFGRALARAVRASERRVLLVASGGLSHVFLPLAQLRSRLQGDPKNIVSEAARAADEQRIEWMASGRHERVIRTMPEFAQFEPEARFGHYLMLAGAMGGEEFTIPGARYSDYESGIGTGHVHLWFEP